MCIHTHTTTCIHIHTCIPLFLYCKGAVSARYCAKHCKTLQLRFKQRSCLEVHIATQCNTLQHVATHCNTLQQKFQHTYPILEQLGDRLCHSCMLSLPHAPVRVAVCFSLLQCVAVCCSILQCVILVGYPSHMHLCVLHCVIVCCSVLQCVAVCCSVLQRMAVCHSCMLSLPHAPVRVVLCCSMLQCIAVCCSMLQCIAICCSVLQCVAAYYSVSFL